MTNLRKEDQKFDQAEKLGKKKEPKCVLGLGRETQSSPLIMCAAHASHFLLRVDCSFVSLWPNRDPSLFFSSPNMDHFFPPFTNVPSVFL